MTGAAGCILTLAFIGYLIVLLTPGMFKAQISKIDRSRQVGLYVSCEKSSNQDAEDYADSCSKIRGDDCTVTQKIGKLNVDFGIYELFPNGKKLCSDHKTSQTFGIIGAVCAAVGLATGFLSYFGCCTNSAFALLSGAGVSIGLLICCAVDLALMNNIRTHLPDNMILNTKPDYSFYILIVTTILSGVGTLVYFYQWGAATRRWGSYDETLLPHRA